MQNPKEEPLVILDIRGLLIHSYHAGVDPDAVTSGLNPEKKVNTADYGFAVFLDMYLNRLLEDFAPRRIVGVWDGGNDYRTAIYADYKKSRKERVKDPVEEAQLDKLVQGTKRFLAYLGATQCSVSGVEADDLIAFLCERVPGHKFVYSVDADLAQLANDDTTVIGCGSGKDGAAYVDTVTFKEGDDRIEVPISLIRMYKSLVGDKSDGYGGVKGFGPKAWLKMVAAYGHDGVQELEQCIVTKDYKTLTDAIAATGDKALAHVYDHREGWAMMYELAGLHAKLCEGVRGGRPVRIAWYKRVKNAAKLRDTLMAFGCLDLFNKYEKWLPRMRLITATNVNDLREYQAKLAESPFVAFDYESFDTLKNENYKRAATKGNYVDVLNQKLTGASFAYGNNLQYVDYISVGHKDTANLDPSAVLWAVQEAERNGDTVVQNAAFEMTVTKTNFGYELKTPHDTAIMAMHVDENEENHLKLMSERILGYKQITYEEVVNGKSGMDELSGAEVLQYGCDDSICTAELYDLFKLILQIERTFDFVCEREHDFVHLQTDGFIQGVRIDFAELKRLEETDAVTLAESTAKMRTLLEEHCKEPNLQGAATLYDDLAEFTEESMKADGKDQEKIEAKLAAMKAAIVEGSKYVPYQEVKQPVEFLPTPAQFAKVCEALGLPPITGVSSKGLTEWVMGLTEEQRATDFVVRLLAAQKELKAREGEAYLELKAACEEALAGTAKSVWVGDELNFDSPQQMQRLLYGKLGLPIRVRSKVGLDSTRASLKMQGAPATDEKAVMTAKVYDAPEGTWQREVLDLLLKIRGCMTREELYYRPYPLWRDPLNVCENPDHGIIHPQIKNCGTVTRRPSGSSPNVLQVSGYKDEGKVRSCYLPRHDDHVIISPDFAGQELRIMTSESLDPVLLDAYIGPVKKDIHSTTAAGIAGIVLRMKYPKLHKELEGFLDREGKMSYEDFVKLLKSDNKEVADAMDVVRKYAKVVNFLIIYGGGPTTLARNLAISVEMARAIMDMVFRLYAGIEPWQAALARFAHTHGYTLTAFGTRRHAPEDLFSRDEGRRMRAERQLANSTIQGCAADILKTVMSECHRTKLFKETGAIMIAPVYDELTASVPKAAAVEYIQRLTPIMELTPPGHKVPMVAEFAIGAKNWGNSIIELKDHPSVEAIEAALEGEKLVKKAA